MLTNAYVRCGVIGHKIISGNHVDPLTNKQKSPNGEVTGSTKMSQSAEQAFEFFRFLHPADNKHSRKTEGIRGRGSGVLFQLETDANNC